MKIGNRMSKTLYIYGSQVASTIFGGWGSGLNP